MKGFEAMKRKIAVIGGDLRIVKLVEMLTKDDFEITTYALEKAEFLKKINITEAESLKEAVNDCDIVIGPIPLSSNNVEINTPFSDEKITLEELANNIEGKKFIAGSIKQDLYKYLNNKNVDIIDLLNREELTVLNTISTAEGAIQIAMEETTRTIHGSNILVLGFGRVGKILSKMLNGIGANVYCEARKNVDLAWIKAYGYIPIHLNELDEYLDKVDIIINTIPQIILDKNRLEKVRKECILIDLASNPGGIDRNESKKRGIKTIWALSLPGKVAPLTSAEFIKETLYNIFKEI